MVEELNSEIRTISHLLHPRCSMRLGRAYIAVQLPENCSGFTDLYVASGKRALFATCMPPQSEGKGAYKMASGANGACSWLRSRLLPSAICHIRCLRCQWNRHRYGRTVPAGLNLKIPP